MSGASTVTDRELATARVAGAFAARRGLDSKRCPYDPAGDARQRTLASAWMRAYLHTRPPAGSVDYSD
jgi:hypothetical protein